MLSIRNEKFIEFNNGISVVIAEIQVDSAEELPETNGISGRILFQGSIAWDISSGDFYGLTSTGEWINQNGGGESDA